MGNPKQKIKKNVVRLPSIRDYCYAKYRKILDKKHVVDDNGCWLWTGRTLFGYGKIKVRKKYFSVHRVSYEIFKGEIGDKLVLHKCNVRGCINPDHLYLGTHTDNYNDMVEAKTIGLVGSHKTKRPKP